MDLREQNFGIEVEMTGITRSRAAEVIAEYLNTTAKYEGGKYSAYSVEDKQNRKWKIVSDASINCQKQVGNRKQIADREYSVEFDSLICKYEDIEKIQEMVRALRGETVSAFVYVMTDGHRLGMPSDLYRKTVEEGYKTAGFDSAILENAITKTEERMLVEQEKEQEQESMFRMSWW